ncbi:RNA exonuclease 4 [Austrofundulus limnaeus]|uniref:RNA exonuclease 4 n=1 Tax=Austrofundulus limnaeus TaxID=52670 RepID=A0A2I4B7K9_AUSLI|nr:PREDICTED: RNA exonuclease 4 [Austrofundulus limnaeus]
MSKTKKKKTNSDSKTHKPTAKDKRKDFWIKRNPKKKFQKVAAPLKHQEKAETQQTAPPVKPQQFSSNWKALQEILKASQPEKKSPATQKQNGVFPKKAKENASKGVYKNNAASNQMDAEKKQKPKSAPNSVPKETGLNLKDPSVSDARPPAAPKRKKDKGKSNSEPEAKKTKYVEEKRKPTEEDLWFDDVDPDDVEETIGAEAAEIMRRKQGVHKSLHTESALVKEKGFEGLTRVVAVDCEMVGIGPGGEDSMLARVSIVNQFGKCIYDKYVKPTEEVTDYRTEVSGIRPEDIKDGENVQTVQKEVADILQGRIVVGHAVHNDFKILLLDHPKKKIRDTQKYKPFKKIAKSGRPSLKVLCKEVLNVRVQQGEHSSVQDAQATMRLYTLVKKQWEAEIKASKTKQNSEKKNERKTQIKRKSDEI